MSDYTGQRGNSALILLIFLATRVIAHLLIPGGYPQVEY